MSCKQCSKFSLHGEMHCRRNDRDVDGPWVLPLWLDQLRQHPEAVFRQLCWSNFQGVTLKKTDVMNNIQGDWNLLSGRNADLFFDTKSFSGCWQASSWLYAGICFCFSILGLFFFKEATFNIFPFFDEKVFVYVNLMLSKMNCVEQRIWLSIVGILRWPELHEMWTLSIQEVYVLVCVAFSLLSP